MINLCGSLLDLWISTSRREVATDPQIVHGAVAILATGFLPGTKPMVLHRPGRAFTAARLNEAT